MKKIIFLSAYLLFTVSVGLPQWYVQDTRNDVDGFFSIDFLNENNGISCGVERTSNHWGRALYTTNSGANWYLANVPDSARDFYSCTFINEQLCYMGGNYHDSSKGIPYVTGFLLKSSDGGMNWSTFSTLPSQYDWLIQMDFLNETTGYVIAQIVWAYYRPISCILKTTDAGESWTTQLTLDSLSDLWVVQCINEDVIFSVGGNGHDEFDYGSILVKSINGGLNWTRQVFDELVSIDNIFFTDENNGVFVGRGNGYGYIYRTTNQGLNWMKADSISNIVQLINVDFYSGSGVGMVYGFQTPGMGAFIWRTIDYGMTWTPQSITSSTQGLYGGVMLSSTNNYIVAISSSVNAQIFHTTNGGSTFVNNPGINVPTDFSLNQNYPNPFNPKTSITYSISKAQLITLKVFDALGNNVAILINEKQNPGTYSVNWDASNYSSGIYFYTLEGNFFSRTKKMILIK